MAGAGYRGAVFRVDRVSSGDIRSLGVPCRRGGFIVHDEDPNRAQLIAKFAAEGGGPCLPGDAEPTDWRGWIMTITELAFVFGFISVLVLGRNLFLFLRYRRYLGDHRAFLKKYDRLP